jgi:hypothetical protein
MGYITDTMSIFYWNKVCHLVNQSTTTKIESLALEFLNKPIIKSIVISYHFQSGILKGFNFPIECQCYIFIF